MNYALIRNYARQLRTNQTPAETFVWDKVRNRNFHGFKFTRQYIISFKLYTPNIQYFIVDFYCHEKKLILEIDGEYHNYQLEADIERDKILNAYGYKVLRLTNEEVLDFWWTSSLRILKILNKA